MIEQTDEMLYAAMDHIRDHPEQIRAGLDAVLAIVERDYYVSSRPTPEQIAAWPKPKRRIRACVENWPGALIDGDYDPRCCRWPKSCSADSYDAEQVTEEYLESDRGAS